MQRGESWNCEPERRRKNMDSRTEDHEERIATLEAKVQELETLVNIALRLSAAEKPISALLSRYGATEAETLAVHALLDDVLKRVQAGGSIPVVCRILQRLA